MNVNPATYIEGTLRIVAENGVTKIFIGNEKLLVIKSDEYEGPLEFVKGANVILFIRTGDL